MRPSSPGLQSGGRDETVRIYDGRAWVPQRQIEEQARCLVDGLFARPLLKAEVVARLRGHKGVGDDVRRVALELAGGYQDEPGRFNRAARDVVRWRDAPAALYRQALDWTETACRLAPDDGACLTTRGIAQFRAGRDAEAQATLARAERLNQGDDGERVADWAFLALAHHRLGHKDEATATLARLREALAKEAVGRTGEAQSFLAEAVAAIQGPDK